MWKEKCELQEHKIIVIEKDREQLHQEKIEVENKNFELNERINYVEEKEKDIDWMSKKITANNQKIYQYEDKMDILKKQNQHYKSQNEDLEPMRELNQELAMKVYDFKTRLCEKRSVFSHSGNMLPEIYDTIKNRENNENLFNELQFSTHNPKTKNSVSNFDHTNINTRKASLANSSLWKPTTCGNANSFCDGYNGNFGKNENIFGNEDSIGEFKKILENRFQESTKNPKNCVLFNYNNNEPSQNNMSFSRNISHYGKETTEDRFDRIANVAKQALGEFIKEEGDKVGKILESTGKTVFKFDTTKNYNQDQPETVRARSKKPVTIFKAEPKKKIRFKNNDDTHCNQVCDNNNNNNTAVNKNNNKINSYRKSLDVGTANKKSKDNKKSLDENNFINKHKKNNNKKK